MFLKNNMMKGFILAGGRGTRLRPVTYEIPKPLLPVKGRAVITHLVDLFLENEVEDIKINILEEDQDDFRNWKEQNFPDKKISFIVEKNPTGTFTPLIKSGEWFSEAIVVSNGDELKELDLKKMVKMHKEKKSLATIALTKVDNPKNYGVVKLTGEMITEFMEKPKSADSKLINSGLYVLSPEIKDYYPEDKKCVMLEKDLFPLLSAEKKLKGYVFDGRWQDIGTFNRWEKAIKKW